MNPSPIAMTATHVHQMIIVKKGFASDSQTTVPVKPRKTVPNSMTMIFATESSLASMAHAWTIPTRWSCAPPTTEIPALHRLAKNPQAIVNSFPLQMKRPALHLTCVSKTRLAVKALVSAEMP